MKLNQDKEWFKKSAEIEGNSEIGAGSSTAPSAACLGCRHLQCSGYSYWCRKDGHTCTRGGVPKQDNCFEKLERAPLARGRRYQFNGYPSGFTIKYVAFRGHPEDDGGLEGVAVEWWGGIHRRSMFYPCKNDAEFWQMEMFTNAYDSPNAKGESHSLDKQSMNTQENSELDSVEVHRLVRELKERAGNGIATCQSGKGTPKIVIEFRDIRECQECYETLVHLWGGKYSLPNVQGDSRRAGSLNQLDG